MLKTDIFTLIYELQDYLNSNLWTQKKNSISWVCPWIVIDNLYSKACLEPTFVFRIDKYSV
jgi:hypothetical protein